MTDERVDGEQIGEDGPRAPEGGKLLKVIALSEDGERTSEWTQQLPPDPFKDYKYQGLQEPPFSLEQLVFLSEQHPTHSAALEQKAADIVGQGWRWKLKDEEKGEDDKQRDELDGWFNGLAEAPMSDETTHEVLLSAWSDLETVGQGLIELSRDPKGELRHWFHVPAHTCRFHRDGLRIAQVRQGKRVWFKRWTPPPEKEADVVEVDRITSAVTKGKGSAKNRANEILVLKRHSRRSSWYGVPTYISATGWITLSSLARDDNIYFFENRREPRWVVVLENVEDDGGLEESLQDAFKNDLKKPHRNLILPLSGPAKATFHSLGDNKGDMSWERLQERADANILLAHRLPGDRIGMTRVGPLGGSVVEEASRTYKEGLVQTSQALLTARINKLIEAESGIEGESLKYIWEPKELDLTEQNAVEEGTVKVFQGGIIMLNEARERLGEEPLEEEDERGLKFAFELGAMGQGQDQGPNGEMIPGAGDLAGLTAAHGDLAQRIKDLLGQGGLGE